MTLQTAVQNWGKLCEWLGGGCHCLGLADQESLQEFRPRDILLGLVNSSEIEGSHVDFLKFVLRPLLTSPTEATRVCRGFGELEAFVVQQGGRISPHVVLEACIHVNVSL